MSVLEIEGWKKPGAEGVSGSRETRRDLEAQPSGHAELHGEDGKHVLSETRVGGKTSVVFEPSPSPSES